MTCHNKGGKKKKNEEYASTSAETQGVLEHVVMACELETTKEDQAVNGVTKEDMTKLMMKLQDLKCLQ